MGKRYVLHYFTAVITSALSRTVGFSVVFFCFGFLSLISWLEQVGAGRLLHQRCILFSDGSRSDFDSITSPPHVLFGSKDSDRVERCLGSHVHVCILCVGSLDIVERVSQ